MRQRLSNFVFLLAVFLLPFQTQWILSEQLINGGVSQYGKLSIYVVEILFVIALLFRGRLRFVSGSEKIVKHLYFIFAVGFFSLTLSQYFNVALFQLGHILIAGIVFMLLLDERLQIKNVMYAFVLGLLVPIVLGWIQFFSGSSPASTLLGLAQKQVETLGVAVVETMTSRSLRAYGTFPHPNIFGGYLAIGILFLAWLVRFSKEKWQLALIGVFTVLFSSTLILTFSRSAWLALTVSLFVLLLQMLVYKKIPPRKAYPIMGLGLATIVLSVLVLSPQVFARFQTSLRVEAISIEERFSQYDSVGTVVKIKPLFGHGPAGYVFALSQIVKDKEVWFYQPIHNSFLLMMAEVGILGVLVFLYWLKTFIKSFSGFFKKSSGIFCVGFGVAFLILGLFDHYLWSSWSGLVLFFLSIATVIRWRHHS